MQTVDRSELFDDEADLAALQQHFEQSEQPAAARVTRIGRRAGALAAVLGSASQLASAGQQCSIAQQNDYRSTQTT